MSNKNNWPLKSLNELGFVGRGRSRHRPRNEPSLYGGQYPFFQTGDIKAAELYLYKYEQTYNEKGLAQSKLWQSGTLCITIAANIAETAILKIPGCFPDSVIGFVSNPKQSDVQYVKYYIDFIKFSLQNISHGTTQDNLSLEKMLSFRFPIPNVQLQKKIAAILSAYDELIENNSRRIKILEEMARMIYQEWFVKFRFPGHEQAKFVESPLGMIPAGWEVKTLEDVAKDFRRSVQLEFVDSNTPYVGLEHIPRRSIALLDWGKASDVQSMKLSFKKGEILFGKIRPYFHKVAIAPVDGVCSSDAIVISAKNKSLYPLVLMCVSSDEFVGEATQTSNGTKMPRANWNVLLKYKILIPQNTILQLFNESIFNIINNIQNLLLKNRNLRQTRDMLLPKLISGEIDVSDLDIPMEER